MNTSQDERLTTTEHGIQDQASGCIEAKGMNTTKEDVKNKIQRTHEHGIQDQANGCIEERNLNTTKQDKMQETQEHGILDQASGTAASSETLRVHRTSEAGTICDGTSFPLQGDREQSIVEQMAFISLNDELSTNGDGAENTFEMKTQGGSQVREYVDVTPWQISVNVTFNIGTKNEFKVVTNIKCSVHEYMVCKYFMNSPHQCNKSEKRFPSEKIEFKGDSAIAIKTPVNNRQHAVQITKRVLKDAVQSLRPCLSVEPAKSNSEDIIRKAKMLNDSFGVEIAYAEAIQDRIYIVFPSMHRESVKQFISDCKDENGISEKLITVQKILLKIPSVKKDYLDSGSVQRKNEEPEHTFNCSVKGSENLVKRVVNELESKNANLKTKDVLFSARITNALEELNIEDIVNRRLEKLYPNCVLQQTGGCLRLFSFKENESLKAVSYVGDMIIERNQQLHGEETKKSATVEHLKKTYEGTVLVGFDRAKSWLYLVGLKDAVTKAVNDIQEGQITANLDIREPQPQEVIDSYPVRKNKHFRYLKNSKYIRKFTDKVNVQTMFQHKECCVEVKGTKDGVDKTIEVICNLEKDVVAEDIIFEKNKSVYLHLNLDSLTEFEDEFSVSVEKQDIQMFSYNETSIFKEVHDKQIQWSIKEKERSIYLECESLENVIAFLKVKPVAQNPSKGNILKGEYLAEMGIPTWKDGKHFENEDLAHILTKVMNEAGNNREQILTVALLLTPVSNWTFDGLMKCIVNCIMKWLLTSANKLPHTVKLCTEDRVDFSKTIEYMDKCAGFHIQASEQTRMLQASVCKGQLDQIKADVLVNTAAQNLDLTKGFVSASLLRTAGSELQNECRTVYPRGIGYDEVAVTKGYGAGCEAIFHVALPPYYSRASTGCVQTFQTVMMNCLEKAASMKYTSIAFPAMGTGSLGYPVEVVASEMFASVERFNEKNPGSTLETAFFVIYDKDNDLFEYFEKIKEETDKPVALSSSKFCKKSAVKLEVTGKKEDVAKAKSYLDKMIKHKISSAPACKSITGISSEIFDALKHLHDMELNSFCESGVKVEYIQSRNEILVEGETSLVTSASKTLKEFLAKIEEMHTCVVCAQHVPAASVEEALLDLRYCRKDVCYVYDPSAKCIKAYATSKEIVDDVQKDLELKINGTNSSVSYQEVPPTSEEIMDTSETAENLGACSLPFTPTVHKPFSWSTGSKHLRVYQYRNVVVKVYEANIIEVPVDGIVNAANSDLQHCGGVARTIAVAAGADLVRESECLIRHNKGPLDVASVVYTKPGNLHFKCILHAVGPRWSDYQPIKKISLKQCERDLEETVLRSLRMAEDKDLETVALPTISSGIFKVPKDLCAIQYASAVMKFKGSKKLKEIHFVDLDPCMIDIMHKTFEAMITKKGKPPFDTSVYLSRDKRSGKRVFEQQTSQDKNERDTKRTWPKCNDENAIDVSVKSVDAKLICSFESHPVADIYEGNILILNGIDGIVCSEDGTGQAKGMIAKLLLQKGGENYRRVKSTQFTSWRNQGEVIVTPGGNNKYKWVFHAVVPRKITTDVSFIYENIFKKANEREIKTLALPLLCTGSGGMDEVSSTQELFKALIEFHCKNRQSRLKVHVVLKDKMVANVVQDVFKRLVVEMSPQKKTDQEINRPDEMSEMEPVFVVDDNKTSSLDSNHETIEENCVICMDTVDDAEILKCGHKFCKECIEGYFKVKQVCPTCGEVCGIITGDQPCGSMEVVKRRLHLSGFERHNSISITYQFRSGKQEEGHPRPGTTYKGITRTAFLPDNTEGREICAMLMIAFDRRLVFTIGTSRTTGEEGVITWNDIHHKTDMRPNTQFGYPDESYLQRVREELEVKGVTLEDGRKFVKALQQLDFGRNISLSN